MMRLGSTLDDLEWTLLPAARKYALAFNIEGRTGSACKNVLIMHKFYNFVEWYVHFTIGLDVFH